MATDIIIFATPVWCGIQSSLTQKGNRAAGWITRWNHGYWIIIITNKRADIVVTSDSDGVGHVIGNLAYFFSALWKPWLYYGQD